MTPFIFNLIELYLIKSVHRLPTVTFPSNIRFYTVQLNPCFCIRNELSKPPHRQSNVSHNKNYVLHV